jgi:flagellar basal body L-ring protein FlgH
MKNEQFKKNGAFDVAIYRRYVENAEGLTTDRYEERVRRGLLVQRMNELVTGSVTVSVIEVQPNGNLVVRGEKRLALTQGTEMIQVSGIIRPEDVAPNNTVQSRRLANANFVYQGGGELGSVARSGWGTRAILNYWPF